MRFMEDLVVCLGLYPGRDCMGCAKTGSGKTAAFVLPVLQKLSEDPYGIFCLVLTPTRLVNSCQVGVTMDECQNAEPRTSTYCIIVQNRTVDCFFITLSTITML